MVGLKSDDSEFSKICQKYNENYNSKLKVNMSQELANLYNTEITSSGNLISYHVAKHLYAVFDFKPLEKEVLVPKQSGDKNIINVYPSASDKNPAEYSIQDGNKYRDLQCNARKGYNKDALFRYKIEKDDKDNGTTKVKELLAQAIIMHISISLTPFSILREREKAFKMFSAFKKLVCADYNSVYESIYLDNEWESSLSQKFTEAWDKIDKSINNSTNPSSSLDDIYVFSTKKVGTTQR